MNKAELVDAIAAQSDVTKKTISEVLGVALDVIANAIANGDKVTLVGFGSFEARERQGRNGINPLTKERVNIPAKRVPAFSAGKSFKELVAK
jgi:DNA-binding protein HU-beta